MPQLLPYLFVFTVILLTSLSYRRSPSIVFLPSFSLHRSFTVILPPSLSRRRSPRFLASLSQFTSFSSLPFQLVAITHVLSVVNLLPQSLGHFHHSDFFYRDEGKDNIVQVAIRLWSMRSSSEQVEEGNTEDGVRAEGKGSKNQP